MAGNHQIGCVFVFFCNSRSKKHRKYGCFWRVGSPKPRYVTMFLDSGSKNHGIYKVFWPAPGKNTGMYAGFTMLQDVVSIFEKVKNTVNYNVLALLLGYVGSAEPPG